MREQTFKPMSNNLRDFRKKVLALTQREAGDKLGVTPVAWSQWERNGGSPSGASMIAISSTFDCVITISPGGNITYQPANGILESRGEAPIADKQIAGAEV